MKVIPLYTIIEKAKLLKEEIEFKLKTQNEEWARLSLINDIESKEINERLAEFIENSIMAKKIVDTADKMANDTKKDISAFGYSEAGKQLLQSFINVNNILSDRYLNACHSGHEVFVKYIEKLYPEKISIQIKNVELEKQQLKILESQYLLLDKYIDKYNSASLYDEKSKFHNKLSNLYEAIQNDTFFEYLKEEF